MTFAPRTWVVGEVVTAALLNQEIRDQFNSMFAAWTAYTPAWTATTTNPALGNGTITGAYIKIGRTCHTGILLTTGSTSTYGSGNYQFSMPFTSASAGIVYLGTARVSGSSTWPGQCFLNAGAVTAQLTTNASSTNASGANVTQAVPETWASGASFRLALLYQTAS